MRPPLLCAIVAIGFLLQSDDGLAAGQAYAQRDPTPAPPPITRTAPLRFDRIPSNQTVNPGSVLQPETP